MKNIIRNSFLLSLTCLFFAACHEIPPEIPEINVSGEKSVVIEEFTGVRCTNCPTAAQAISNLQNQYGENVIAVAIHAPKYSSFTEPHMDSKYDFRIPEADAIADLVEGEILGLPSAMFDRYDFDNGGLQGHVVKVSQYSSALSERLQQPAKFLMSIDNKYNKENRELTTIAHIRPLEDIEGEVYITFMLIENGIVDVQTDKHEIIEDYVHNHVLRDIYSVNPTGDRINQALKDNQPIVIKRSVKIKPPEEGKTWNNPENMETVVFVHRRDGSLTCMQAVIAHVIE